MLLLDSEEVLSDKSLEDAVVVNVLCRKVSKDVRKLPIELCRLEIVVQCLPGDIGDVFLSFFHIFPHTYITRKKGEMTNPKKSFPPFY